MNIRLIATVVALTVPVVALYLVTQYASDKPESTRRERADAPPMGRMPPPSTYKDVKPPTREGEIEFLRKRVADLEKMTDTEWQEEHQKRMQGRPLPPPPETMRQSMNPNEGRMPEIPPTHASPLIEHFPKTRPND